MPASLMDLIAQLRRRFAAGESTVTLTVADPDLGPGLYAGEAVALGSEDGAQLVHRPLRVWVELAARLHLRLAMPRPAGPGRIALTFSVLREAPTPAAAHPTEKYGEASTFARISKLEDPSFVLDFEDALARANLGPAPSVLDLGCNRGEVLDLLLRHRPDCRVVGIDHSASALEVARARFATHRFIEADLRALPNLALPRFDLVLGLSTLHSPGVDDRELLRHVVQARLQSRGSVILGVPNCRYLDGELLYGARLKNFTEPELSLVIKNVAYFRKYLQQHKRRVWVTGQNYILVTGAPRPL